MVKNAADLLPSGDPGSIPRSGKFPGEGNGNPLQYACLGKSHGCRSLAGPWSHESQTQLNNYTTTTYCLFGEEVSPGVNCTLPISGNVYTEKWKVKVAQSCPALCDPMNYTVHGILQARILEWVAFSFSRGSSQIRDQTQVSHIAGRFFTNWATREAHVCIEKDSKCGLVMSIHPPPQLGSQPGEHSDVTAMVGLSPLIPSTLQGNPLFWLELVGQGRVWE